MNNAVKIQSAITRKQLSRYNLIVRLLALPLFLYTAWLGFVTREGRYLTQRFGYGYPKIAGKPIWVHAASVGEVSAVLPLIMLLLEREKSNPVLVTTFTPTGGQFVQKKLSGKITHIFLPIDLNGAVRRFLDSVEPACAIIMETELWPNLFIQCDARKIPLVIINGRLSSRTLNAKAWIRNIYSVILKKPKHEAT